MKKKQESNSKNELIFIQIASYRDKELLPTINDLIQNAKYPKNLRFGICWQHSKEDAWDTLKQYQSDPRFKIIDVEYQNSKGLGWARNQIQKLYQNETYTMQIDSHLRFIKDWDDILINMLTDLQNQGYPKPVITTYPPDYEPEKEPYGRSYERFKIKFLYFVPKGVLWHFRESFDIFDSYERPIRARFFSGGFSFTLGIFTQEVPHDPFLYFIDDEINTSVRAFTHGYDLFHPHINICWHYYGRKKCTKHSDDHKKIPTKMVRGHKRNRQLFEQTKKLGKYGFGNVRTLRDYEKFAGIHFKKRLVQEQTLRGEEPPNYSDDDEEAWEQSFTNFRNIEVTIPIDQLEKNDCECISIDFYNEKDKLLKSFEISRDEIENCEFSNGYYIVWRGFFSISCPTFWVATPYSKSKGWGKGCTGDIE